MSAGQVQADQFATLRARALLALESVPAYLSLRDRIGAVKAARTPEEILDIFPVLTKEEVRLNPESFVPTTLDPARLMTGMTSGTTGTPLRLYRSLESLRRNFAFFRRIRSWRGLSHWDRTATLMGRLVVPAEQAGPPYWRRSHTTNTLFVSSYHLGLQTIADCARAVAEFDPVQVVCYPSSGELLAEGLARIGRRLTRCRAVFTTAETIVQEQRRLIEESIGCPVADQYGSAEWTVWISQCELGSYHLHPEYGFLEVLDSHGKRIERGTGRAIATGFVNDAMVLVRYELGDLVTLNPQSTCTCRRPFPIVESIEGRRDDLVLTPDGRRVGRLDPVFKGVGGIVLAQIEQSAFDELLVRVIPGSEWGPHVSALLLEELRRRVGPSMRVSIHEVADIPRTANGKFRAVIGWRGQEVPQPQLPLG
jgi:phenylacetate-CoA ligase